MNKTAEYFNGYSEAYLYMLSRGCKKVAIMPYQFMYKENAIDNIISLEKRSLDYMKSGIKVNFIQFKYYNDSYGVIGYGDENLNLAERAISLISGKERNKEIHSELGHIFGYSEKAIENFINNLESP